MSKLKFVEIKEITKNIKYADIYFGIIVSETKENFNAICVDAEKGTSKIIKKDFDKGSWTIREFDSDCIEQYFRMALYKGLNEVNDAIFEVIHARIKYKKSNEFAKSVFPKITLSEILDEQVARENM